MIYDRVYHTSIYHNCTVSAAVEAATIGNSLRRRGLAAFSEYIDVPRAPRVRSTVVGFERQ